MLKMVLGKITWRGLAVFVFITTFFVTFLAWNYTKAIVKQERLSEFGAEVREMTSYLESRTTTYNDILYSLQGLFAASESVERNEWSIFIKTTKISQHPDIDQISYAQVVPDSEKAAFTAAFINDRSVRPEGYPEFKIYPEGTRGEYAVVKYVEPESDKTIEIFGLDLYTNIPEKATLDKTRDTGEPQISEKVSIAPDNIDGFVISAPIYQLEEKTVGFVQTVVKVEDLFGSVSNHEDISFSVYDTTSTDELREDNLLYATDAGKYSKNVNLFSKLSHTETINIGGRTWTLKFISTPSFGTSFARSTLPLTVLTGGTSLSALLFIIFYLQGKRAEKRIIASETRYRRLFEAAQDGILILDAFSGKIVDANPFLKTLLGYSKEEIIGKQLWEIGVFKNITTSKEEFFKLQEEGFIRYEDLPLQSKGGQVIEVEFVSNVYYVDNKKVIQCNIRDISARKRIEEDVKTRSKSLEALVKTQEDTKRAMLNVLDDLETAKSKIEEEKVKAEAMLVSIGDGIVATDSEARIVMINRSAENMLHCKSVNVLGKRFFEVWDMEDDNGNPVPKDKFPIQLALSSSNVISTKYCYALKDGTKFPAALTATPILINKKVEGAIEVFRDITKETEVDKAKTEFASLASHQLRTPLGIIKWYLESVRKHAYFKKAPKNTLSYLEEIYKNNERIISVVRDLASVSRIDQARVKNNPESIDIVQLVSDVVNEMNIIAVKRKIKLSFENRLNNPPAVFIDKLRLHEVIENLIANAIDYNITSGKVKVFLDKQNSKMLLIKISDTGIGIPPEDQKKLFTKFFRTEKGTTKNTEGSGLGLYVAKSYVDSWGGKITVKSQGEKGSTFTITIPFDTRDKKKEVNQT